MHRDRRGNSTLVLCSLYALLLAGLSPLRAADPPAWPQFRGPTGQGIAEEAKPPLRWSETENVTWKAPIPGKGWSSPVVMGNKIWMTTATEEGRSLRAIAVDLATGKLLHNVELFYYETPPFMQPKNSHASPTPVLEEDRVYAHFGMQGTAALNGDGEILWKNEELKYQHGNGSGGSPILWRDLLIISCDGYDVRYIVGLDKNDGTIRWKTTRRSGRMAFSTPLLISVEGREQVVVTGGDATSAYDPETGEELWYVTYHGYSNVPRPLFGHGLVYIMTGFYEPELIALRPTGRGDLAPEHVVWRYDRGISLTPSPLLVGDELYFVSDFGIATCLDARTGEERWRARLNGAFSASPVLADGRIYFQDENGRTTVIEPGVEFKKLAESEIDGQTMASLAFVGPTVILRSATHLYRIEEQ